MISGRAQKVAEWKDRKEAILRGEITVTEEATDTGIDSIYEVQEEASYTFAHLSYNFLLSHMCSCSVDECRFRSK